MKKSPYQSILSGWKELHDREGIVALPNILEVSLYPILDFANLDGQIIVSFSKCLLSHFYKKNKGCYLERTRYF